MASSKSPNDFKSVLHRAETVGRSVANSPPVKLAGTFLKAADEALHRSHPFAPYILGSALGMYASHVASLPWSSRKQCES